MDCWYFTQYLGLQIYHYRNHANYDQLFYYAQIVRSDFTDNSISQVSVIYNENINQSTWTSHNIWHKKYKTYHYNIYNRSHK